MAVPSWVYSMFLDPKLSLEHRWRNVFVMSMLIIWVIVLCDVSVEFGLHSFTTATVVSKCANLLLLFGLPFGLLKARHDMLVTDMTMTYLLQCAAQATNVAAILVSTPRPVTHQAFILMIAISLSSLPRWKLQCLLASPAMLVGAYNGSFGLFGYPVLEGYQQISLTSEIYAQTRLLWLVPLTLAAVRTYSLAYHESLRRADCAVQFAKDISETLAEYDTKNAKLLLVQYSQLKNCDNDLHGVLTVIVDNMSKYKPFLPNYIIPSPSSESTVLKDKEDGDKQSISEDAFSESLGAISLEKRTSVSPSDDIMETSNNHIIPLDPPATSSSRRRSGSPQSPSSSRSRIDPQRMLAMVPTTRSVTYSLLDFRLSSDDVIDNPRILRSFVDRVYRYGNATKGAVHTCICDTVHITWNSVVTIPSPEMCAVRFLTMFQPSHATSSSDIMSSRIEVQGSVMTGVGECRMTGTVHQTVLLHIEWREAQMELHQYSRSNHTNVVCKATSLAIEMESLCVDVLDGGVEVYALITSQLRRMFSGVMGDALKAYNEGEYGQAHHVLQESIDLHQTVPTWVSSLHKKIDGLMKKNTL